MSVARADALRTVAFGAITTAYLPLGSAITQNWSMFRIVNNTDGDMLFSFNASTNNLFVPAGSFVLYDLSTNAPPLSVHDNLVLGLLTQLSIKYNTAPTKGDVWLEGIYARRGS